MGQFVQGGNFGCLMSFKKEEDDFPFFGSSLAHLEPKLQLFEVWKIIMMICRTIHNYQASVVVQVFRSRQGEELLSSYVSHPSLRRVHQLESPVRGAAASSAKTVPPR